MAPCVLNLQLWNVRDRKWEIKSDILLHDTSQHPDAFDRYRDYGFMQENQLFWIKTIVNKSKMQYIIDFFDNKTDESPQYTATISWIQDTNKLYIAQTKHGEYDITRMLAYNKDTTEQKKHKHKNKTQKNKKQQK